MISYDSYKNRIEKLAKAKKIAHKFRFLIAGAVAVVLGGSVGLMLAKGTYTSGMTLSAQKVMFNEDYEVTAAKAFLASPRSQKIEYSTDNEEWNTEKPIKAGKYYARTVSPKIVGYSYSKPVEFEILPIDAQFDIVDSSVVYGDVPHCSVPQLVSGHRIADEELVFDYADYGAATTEVSADTSTFKIVDENGEDFTSCYNVTFNSKTLKVANRKINVSAKDYSFTYSGAVQTAENVLSEGTESMLAKGDRAEVVTGIYKNGIRVDAIDADNYTVDIDDIKIMHGTIDVTARYDMTYIHSAFKILQRELSFTTEDATGEYNGIALTQDKYIQQNLVEGHEIVLPEALPYALNVSDSVRGNNAYEITVADEYGNDVTANYNIKYTYGTLTVTKREMSFTTENGEKIYDGVALTQDKYYENNLVSGHEIWLAGNSLPAQTNAGEKQNAYEIYITDENGAEVTDNYKISYFYGKLTVKKRDITVSTGDLTAVFNGEMQTNTEYKSVGGKGIINDPAHGLLHTLKADVPFTVKDVTPAAGVDNTTTYKVYNGPDDVTENYEIVYADYYGKIIIIPRKIYVETTDASRAYNGEPLTAYETKDKDYFTYYINEDGIREEGLKGDDTLTPVGSPASITNFGTVSNVCVYSAGANYVIDGDNYVYGTLKITARRLAVKTASASRQYNGEPLSKSDEYETKWLDGETGSEAGLLGVDKLVVIESSVSTITNKGEIDNTVKYIVVANYEIVESAYEWGTLKITERQIYVITRSDEKEYDGEPLSADDGYQTKWIDDEGNKTEQAGLLNGDELTVYMPCAIYEVGGPETNSPRYNTNGNYTIITEKNEYGTLTITPRPIIVTTASVTKTYDGQPVSKATGYDVNYAVKSESGVWVADTAKVGLITRNGVKDELTCTYEFVYDGAVTDSKGVDNVCEYEHKNSFDKSNYDIHYAYGRFIVTGRAIKIVTATDSKVYDGNALTNTADYETYLVDADGNYILDENNEKQSGLLGDDKLTLVGSPTSKTDVGTVSNLVAYTAPDNYTIITSAYEYGTLTVTQRGIYVYVNSATKVYDGKPLKDSGYKTYTDGSLFGKDLTEIEEDGLVNGDTLTITESSVPSIWNVGTKPNSFYFELPLNANGECNYNLLDTYVGTLEVTVRKIIVVTGDGEWTYDGEEHCQPKCKGAYYLNEKGEKEDALVIGHELVAIESTITKITNYMGDSGIDNLTEYKVIIAVDGASDEGFDLNDNYDIEYEYGRIKIKKAPLGVKVLTTPDITYGETFTYQKYQPGVNNCDYMAASYAGPVNGEQVEIFIAVYKMKNLQAYGDAIAPDENGAYALAAGDYELNCELLKDTFKVYDKNGVEVTYVNENNETVGGINNYNVVSAIRDILTVNKKSITVTVKDKDCEYGGLDLYGKFPENEYEVTAGLDENGLLPYGEEFEFEYLYGNEHGEECTPRDKGDYGIFVNEETIIVNGADGEVENGADNYDITFVGGTLTIKPRTLKVHLSPQYSTYGDGPIGTLYTQEVKDEEAEGEEDAPLSYGEILEIQVKYYDAEDNECQPKNAGTYTVRPYKYWFYRIIDGVRHTSSSYADNYDIRPDDEETEIKGTLEIVRKKITVTVIDRTCEYGGLDGNGKLPGNDFSVDAPAYNEQFELSYFYADENGAVVPKHAGTYAEIIRATATVKGTGASADDNYEITWVYGTLEITPKTLTLVIEDQTSVYGDKLPAVEWYFNNGDIPLNGYGEKDETFKLPYGEQIEADKFFYISEINGETRYYYNGDIINVGLYAIQNNGYAYSNGAESENYIISLGWNKNHSRGNLTVTPRPIALEIDEIASVTYGAEFAYPETEGNYLGTPDLAARDSLQIAVKYLQNNAEVIAKNAGIYTADIDLSKCKVFDNAGNEITFVNDDGETVGGINNYTVTCTTRECEIEKRQLKIKLTNLTVTYGDYDFATENPYYVIYNTNENGIDNYDLANSTELGWGEHISVKVCYVENKTPLGDPINPKNVGTYKITIDGSGVTFYDSDGNEIVNGGENYCGGRVDKTGFMYSPSKLEIEQREIKVSISSLLNVEYGDFGNSVVYSNEIGNYADLSNAAYNEQFKISVIYQQTNEDSELVTVTPKNVGEYVIALDDWEVYDENDMPQGATGKGNYSVSANAGTLEIVPKKLTLLIFDQDCYYGGLDGNGKLPENGFEMCKGDLVNPERVTELPYGEELTLEYYYTFVRNGLGVQVPFEKTYTPKAAGSYIIEVESMAIDGGEEGLANYDIICMGHPYLTIYRAPLSVQLSNVGQIVYGKTFKYSATDYVATGLQYGETLKVAVEVKQNSEDAEVKNVGKYDLWLSTADTLACDKDGGEERNVRLNYSVSYYSGAVEVVPRDVWIFFNNKTITYGEEVPEMMPFDLHVDVSDDTDGELSKSELPYGEVLTFTTLYMDSDKNRCVPVNAGRYGILATVDKLINGEEEGVGNYIFTYSYDVLTINKKDVHIKLDDMSATYGDFFVDGVPATGAYSLAEGEGEVLSFGEQLTVNIRFTAQGEEETENFVTPKNQGNYSVVAHTFTVDKEVDGVKTSEQACGNALTNYNIVCDFAELVISKRAITVTVDSETNYDYGDAPVTNTVEITGGGEKYELPYEEHLYYTLKYYDKLNNEDINHYNAGEYTVVCGDATINMTDPVTDNYDVEFVDGKLTVNKKAIIVKVESFDKPYGTVISELEILFTVSDKNGVALTALPFGDELKLTYAYGKDGEWTTEPQNKGIYAIDINTKAVENGNERVENYAITPYFGTLEITPFTVNVTVTGDEVTYGEDYIIEYSYTETLPYGEELTVEFEFVNSETGATNSMPVAAGTYCVTVADEKVENGNERADNYNIVYADNDPELIINKKSIKLTLNASGTVKYEYGLSFDDADNGVRAYNAEGLLEGQYIEIAVTYSAFTNPYSAKTNSARRASTYAAGLFAGEEKFMPRNVGKYFAELDWNSCVLYDADGNKAEGGMNNYELEYGFECTPVEFEIVPMSITVTVENDSADYGVNVSEVEIAYTVNEALPYDEEVLTLAFEIKDGAEKAKNAGAYSITISNVFVENGRPENYLVDYSGENPLPEFVINQKELNLVLTDLTVQYKNEVKYPEGLNNYEIAKSTSTAYGEQIEITEVMYLDESGNKTTEFNVNDYGYDIVLVTFAVYGKNGSLIEDGISNYLVDVENCRGKLKITTLGIVITTGSATKEYDGTPLYCKTFTYEGELAEGYEIVPLELKGPTDVTGAIGEENKSLFKVQLNGEDSDNYAIIYSANCGRLTVTPRKIKISTENASKYYDGTPLQTGYTLSYIGTTEGGAALGDGDEIETETASLTEWQSSTFTNAVTFVIKNSDGKEVQNTNYSITTEFGTLRIDKVEIDIVLNNITNHVYGEELGELYTLTVHIGDTETSATLPNGEELVFDVVARKSGVVYTTEGLLAVGNYQTSVTKSSLKIVCGNANLDNYKINSASIGGIQVIRRSLTVTVNSGKWIYDGKAHSDGGYEKVEYLIDGEAKQGLLEGDELTVKAGFKLPEITAVGTKVNHIEYEVPNANYSIVQIIDGELKVTEREITVRTDDIVAVYDGQEHYGDNLSLTAGTLAEDQSFVVGTADKWTNANEGEDVKNVVPYAIHDKNGDDVTANYKITDEYGSVRITRRLVEITTDDYSGEYDGSAQGTDGYSVTDNGVKDEGVLGGLNHVLIITKLFTWTDATVNEENGCVANETEFGVFLNDENGEDLTANYNIVVTAGEVVIEQKAVTVTLNTVSVEYGGSHFGELNAQAEIDGLVGEDGLTLAFTYDKEVGDVDVYTAKLDWANAKGVNGGHVNNYKLANAAVPSVQFDIYAKSITVVLNDALTAFEYGNGRFGEEIANATVTGLVNGEELVVALKYQDNEGNDLEAVPADKGAYKAVLDWANSRITVDGTEKTNGLNNYEQPECDRVSFTITSRKITVSTLNVTVAYSEDLSIEYPARKENAENYADIQNLLAGETLEITSVKYMQNGEEVTPSFAGKYDIVVTGIKVTDAEGNDVTANYVYETAKPYGVLEIEGVGLVITRLSQTKAYDGTALSLEDYAIEDCITYTVGGKTVLLPADYTIALDISDGVYSTDGANVQTVVNTAKYKVIKGGVEAGEFVVTYDESTQATLEITKREVKYSTDTESKAYDGTALIAGYTLDDTQLVSGHTAAGTQLNRPVNAGTYDNEYSFTVTDAEGADVTTNYSFVAEVQGTLTVNKVKVTVAVNGVNAVYGEEIDFNGATLTDEDGNETVLPNGESLSLEVYFTDLSGNTVSGLLNTGSYKIVVLESSVSVDKNGKDNYEFTFVSGDLAVAARTIRVITDDVIKIYDGKELHVGGYTTKFVTEDGTEKAGLLNGEELVIDGDEIEREFIVNVGTKKNTFSYAVPNGNYVIDTANSSNGTLTITERYIEIVTGSGEWTYDGTVHSQPEAEAIYFVDESGNRVESEVGLVAGHELAVSKAFSVINATEGTDNETEYIVESVSVNGNYKIVKYTYGTLIVNKATLTVTLSKDGKHEFDYGEDYETEIKNIGVTGFVGAEQFTKIEVTYNVEQPKNVGSYTATLKAEACECTVVNGTHIANGLANYEIESGPFSFEINQKAITLVLEAWADEDYGTDHYYEGACTLAAGSSFAYGEGGITFVEVGFYTDAEKTNRVSAPVNSGTYVVELDPSMTMLKNSDEPLSTNYAVTCEDITFKVRGIKFTVQISNAQTIYNGEEYDYVTDENKTFKILNEKGEELNAKDLNLSYAVGYSDTPVNAGTYTVELNKSDLTYDTVNYFYAGAEEITCQLTIKQRELEVIVDSLTVEDDGNGNKVYTADNLSADCLWDFGGGFMGTDLETALADGSIAFKYTAKASKPAGATGYYEVTLVVDDKSEILKNYKISYIEEGYLTVTERKVSVTPVYNGAEKTYDGTAVDLSDFGFAHGHDIENAAESDTYGFTAAQLAGITATYTFVDENGNELAAAPVNAGKYTVNVRLSGSAIANYLITYETLSFEIKKRTAGLTLAIVDDEFVYGATAPDTAPALSISATERQGYQGFVGGLPSIEYALMQNGEEVTRYNAGEYRVGIRFNGIDNYELEFNTLTVTIKPRTIVIGPKAPAGGTKQQYNGSDLTLGSKDYEVYSKELPNGDIVEGDDITITANGIAPTAKAGYVKITGYTVTSGESGNYEVIFAYDATNELIAELGLNANKFQIRMEYLPIEIHYSLATNAGKNADGNYYNYTGNRISHSFDPETVIASCDAFGFGHRLEVEGSVYTTTSEKAGRYENWLKNFIRVYDDAGNNVSAIYSIICDNAADEAVVVISNKLTVTIADNDVSSLPVGKLESGYSVAGLFDENGIRHQAEVYVLDRNGEKFFGVTVFKASGSSKVDVGTSYELAGDSSAQIVTLTEAAALSKPALAVEITASSPEGLFSLNSKGLWQMNGGYRVTGLKGNDQITVYLYVDDDGNYCLGITVSDENGADVRSSYNLYDVVTNGVSARFVSVTESVTLKREIYLDFTGATVSEDGTVSGFTVNDGSGSGNHVVEATYADGVYTVVIYENGRIGSRDVKYDRTGYYKVVSAATVILINVNTLK